MKTKALYFVAFFVGAAAGVAASFKYAQKKYEQIAQEEIDSVKEAFSRKDEELTKRVEEVKATQQSMADQAKSKPNVMAYASVLADSGYTNYAKPEPNESPNSDTNDMLEKPYVIHPDEFGEMDDYETFSLSYYSDGVVADDNDDLVDDVDEVIGLDSLKHFGEYEDDSVFVRNDRLKCDYEILLDQRRYSDLINRRSRIEVEIE